MEHKIILAGSGGQGILFLGGLFAYSGMFANKEVTWFPSYGAEMRGGTANCTVIISDEMIGSPVVRNPDILIVMNLASYNRFSERIVENGLLIYNSSLVSVKDVRKDIKAIPVPASDIASSLKNVNLANMVIAGAFTAVTKIFSIETILKAIEFITPPHRKAYLNINKDLIIKGYNLINNTL